MASVKEIMQLCRLCLVKDHVNVPIFEEHGDNRQISMKISTCLPVKVSKDDNLPKKVCDGCSCKLDVLYEFYNTSASSEKQLLEWLDQANVNQQSTTATDILIQYPHSIDEDLVKQEVIDIDETQANGDFAADDLNVPVDSNYLLQETFEFEQAATSSTARPSATVTSATVKAAPKRKRRAAASKPLPPQTNSEDEDDVDAVETKVAKTEYLSDDDNDNTKEEPETTFVGLPTDNEQPGPSGVEKADQLPTLYHRISTKIERMDAICITDPQCVLSLKRQKQINKYTKNVKVNVHHNKKTKVTSKKVEKTKNLKKPNKVDKIVKKKIGKKSSKSKIEKKIQTVESKNQNSESTNNERVYCEICDENFQDDLQFALHTIKHNNNEKYNCYSCEFQTPLKHSLIRHVKSHRQKPSYKCEMCTETFSSRLYALEHKYFHTGEKPFQCELCGKDFMFSRHLYWHRRTYHWENSSRLPYDCEACNKHYLTAKGLRLHKQRYHTEGFDQSRICDICGKKLASWDNLKFHMRIHTGYKPHACTVCSKSFKRKEQLIEHQRVHTGERPFICSYCDKGFTQRASLNIHKRLHTGEKPYICRLCNRGFVSKGAMDVHMKKCFIVKE